VVFSAIVGKLLPLERTGFETDIANPSSVQSSLYTSGSISAELVARIEAEANQDVVPEELNCRGCLKQEEKEVSG
jgi:hypothetical protein